MEGVSRQEVPDSLALDKWQLSSQTLIYPPTFQFDFKLYYRLDFRTNNIHISYQICAFFKYCSLYLLKQK